MVLILKAMAKTSWNYIPVKDSRDKIIAGFYDFANSSNSAISIKAWESMVEISRISYKSMKPCLDDLVMATEKLLLEAISTNDPISRRTVLAIECWIGMTEKEIELNGTHQAVSFIKDNYWQDLLFIGVRGLKVTVYKE